jgi:hypothetical protein
VAASKHVPAVNSTCIRELIAQVARLKTRTKANTYVLERALMALVQSASALLVAEGRALITEGAGLKIEKQLSKKQIFAAFKSSLKPNVIGANNRL